VTYFPFGFSIGAKDLFLISLYTDIDFDDNEIMFSTNLKMTGFCNEQK
jgi:hypothetical protein